MSFTETIDAPVFNTRPDAQDRAEPGTLSVDGQGAVLVVVTYNVRTDGGICAKDQLLHLPHNLRHIIETDDVRPRTLSLRSPPLGRLEHAFERQPTDAELLEALEHGWLAHEREIDFWDTDAYLIAQAMCSRGF